MSPANRRIVGFGWLALAWIGFVLLPWQGDDAGILAFDWTKTWPSGTGGSALGQALFGGRYWLLPLALPIALAAIPLRHPQLGRATGLALAACSLLALAWLAVVALSIDLRGWTWSVPQELFGPLSRRNPGLGLGAFVYAFAALMLICRGLAAYGVCDGDFFVTGMLGTVVATIGIFVVYPLVCMGVSAFQTPRGAFAPEMFFQRLANPRIWAPGGVVLNTLLLGIASATSSTFLALTFALVTDRTAFFGRRVLRFLSILPIIAPPFVVGLALILLMGRNGAINKILEWAFGFEGGRWIYGFPGVWFAQTLSFTPVAYLVLIGVIQGINPALEEAAQTLRAGPGRVFRTVTLPLALPGIANAFLIGFIESLADFGNPLLLGGDFQVLATSIYFAIVGARQDRGVAAVLGLILLAIMIAVFVLQRRTLANKTFVTIAGKGQGGGSMPLPAGVRWTCLAIAIPWAALTLVIYGMIVFGGFVENWGLNHTVTLKHYIAAFSVISTDHGLRFTGQAWDSLFTTLKLSLIAAPLTAVFGLMTAYLLARRRFFGRTAFEIGTLTAAAIPGTVLGIAYILAFNNPPLELVQTGLIVVISFMVRNMGPGVRAGLATLAQIDRSLEEASLTLRSGSFGTVCRILIPLLRPAILAGIVYGFVSAMTSISAVIFLVSPGVMLSTVYIVNLAEAGTYGVAIAYASVLIVLMLAVITGIQFLIGERRLRRRSVVVLAKAT
ncbi:MAG: iron ABC transporter permease [Alphaproteobacteria bacterium]|nr:iron ABC transporter permease [Alphaproteobacteria bacterium]